jgi:AraC family transcriptional regulator of adaptative response/methylated-DNA-[protein]-cysteine methyltransferase
MNITISVPANRDRSRARDAQDAIGYDLAASSLGLVLAARSDRGLCAILLGDDADALIADLCRRFPQSRAVRDTAGLADWLAHVVRCVEHAQDDPGLPLDLRGTPFQRRVWQALRAIPRGATASYGEIARRIGEPQASRAVAAACASNPLALAIPCHRVVKGDGALSGYRWGVERKRALLEREAAVA